MPAVAQKPGSKRPPTIFIESRKEALRYLDEAAKQPVVSLDTEFDLDGDRRDVIVVFSYSWGRGIRRVVHGDLIEAYADWLVDRKIKKVYQTYTADNEKFAALGLDMGPSFYADIEVEDWLHDENDKKHGLKHQCLKWLRWRRHEYTTLFSYVPAGKKKPLVLSPSVLMAGTMDADALAKMSAEAWLRLFKNYSGDDAESTILLHQLHRRYLKSIGYWPNYLKIDQRYTLTLEAMGDRGMPLDLNRLRDGLDRVLRDRMRARTAFRLTAGQDVTFNINSDQQVKELLFNRFKWPTREDFVTATGNPQLNATALAWYAGEHGFPLAKIMQAYKSSDTNRKFFVGMINGVSKDGRIRSDWKQTGTDTGRASSRKWTEKIEVRWLTKRGLERIKLKGVKFGANLQNVPRKKEKDRYGMRRAFVAMAKHMLVVADYGGFELLMAIHWASKYVKRAKMLDMMLKHKSPSMIHALTAKTFRGLKCELEEVKKLHPAAYDEGKQTNFTLIYGGYAPTIAMRLGWDAREEKNVKRAQRYIDIWNDLYTEMAVMQQGQIAHGYEYGYVTTIAGRHVHVKEGLASKDGATRSYWERKCVNTPCQGSAADIVKVAMNLIEDDEELTELCEGEGMIGQVHDEIILHVPEKNAEAAKERMVFLMKQPFKDKLKFELVVDAHIGPDWDAAKG